MAAIDSRRLAFIGKEQELEQHLVKFDYYIKVSGWWLLTLRVLLVYLASYLCYNFTSYVLFRFESS